MGQGFQVNIANNCGQPVYVSTTNPNSVAAGTGSIPLPLQLLTEHSLNDKLGHPLYVELAGSTTGRLGFTVSLSLNVTGNSFVLEFDKSSLTNFPEGVGFFGSVDDISRGPLPLPGGGFVIPTLYLGTYEQWTLITVLLLAGTNTYYGNF
jgi:hypothetical protein